MSVEHLVTARRAHAVDRMIADAYAKNATLRALGAVHGVSYERIRQRLTRFAQRHSAYVTTWKPLRTAVRQVLTALVAPDHAVAAVRIARAENDVRSAHVEITDGPLKIGAWPRAID